MKGWIPVPGSVKGKLALLALEEFGARGYEAVNVVELAARAGVTTGSLYHHFGNKLGLYAFVREEAERRIVDRMEGAAAATGKGLSAARAALVVGLDAAATQRIAGLLAEMHPEGGRDPVVELLERILSRDKVLARLLAAAWREALREVGAGAAVARARAALERLAS